MPISSLKIVKAQKKAINLAILLPFTILLLVMGYLIFINYQLQQQFMWDWLSIYLLPLIFMVIFDGILLMVIYKKSNLNDVLAPFTAAQLADIDSQCGEKKISLFKTPLIYTDKVIFIANGLGLQAFLPQDLIWLKHHSSTGAIEIITRKKKRIKIHSQFSADFFQQFVDKIRTNRPFILVSDNFSTPEYKELSRLFKRDFTQMLHKADGE